MKKRMIALLLLLVIALTACSSSSELSKDGKEPKDMHRSEDPAATEALDDAGVDIGAADGNTYRNVSLGFICEFPEDWYIYNDDDIASLNNLVSDALDRAAIADAIGNGQVVIFFCASHPETYSSVNINVSKNPMPDADESGIIEATLPQLKSKMEQTGTMENVTCSAGEAEFCGQTRPAIKISAKSGGMDLYEKILYLIDGEYLYTLTVSSGQESMTVDILDYFTSLN